MDRCLVGWAFVDGFPVRSCSPFTPTPRFAFGTSGSSLLTKRIRRTDFTARAVSSDTSGPSETVAPTLPSSRSKVSAQKKRLNFTSERFAAPPDSQSTNLNSPCVTSV